MSDVSHCAAAHPTTRPARTSLFAMIARYRALARQRRILSLLDEHRLEDIGISAPEQRAEAERPFWDAPRHWIQ